MYVPGASPTQSGTLGGAVTPNVARKELQRDRQVAELQREVAQLREVMAHSAQAADITVVVCLSCQLIKHIGVAAQNRYCVDFASRDWNAFQLD